MYMGWATKWALTPLIVMLVASSTAAKLSDVILPSEVVMAVL